MAIAFSSQRLSGRLSGHDNALNAIRLLLAGGVIVSHGLDFADPGANPVLGDFALGGWCVSGFFALSGYLVTGSRQRLAMPRFLARRAARILPGFWACLVLTAVVFAPLSTVLSPRDHVEPGSALGYVVRNAGLWIFQGDIDATLRHVSVPGDWNGSLWTLSFEFAAYVGIGLMMWAARSPSARLRVAVLALGLGTAANAAFEVRGTSSSILTHGTWLATFFLAGTVLRLIDTRLRLSVPAAVTAAVLVVLACLMGLPTALAPVPLAYALLCAGALLPVRLGSRNDISYGVYIYAFPITQLLLVARPATQWNPWLLMLATLVLVVPLAGLSWCCVEHPAMQWQRRWERRRAERAARAAPVALAVDALR